MSNTHTEIINLSGVGLSRESCAVASRWMAKAFAAAPATPALTIFFGAAPYEENVEMHEKFWASHLNRVAMSGILIGAKQDGDWRGFRAFFEPGKSRMSYMPDFRIDDNRDWDRFLALAGEEAYLARVREWAQVTQETNVKNGIVPADFFTTSIIVVNPSYQRKGIGKALDDYTLMTVRKARGRLHIRIHEHILPFYLSQGYQLLDTPTYTICGSQPFKVHFLVHDG